MLLKYKYILLLLLVRSAVCHAQIEGTYCQSVHLAYSDCYWFDKEDKIFEHTSTSDDGETWRGTGRYSEKGSTIELHYNTPTQPQQIIPEHPQAFDSIDIHWYNLTDEKQYWFLIEAKDSNGKQVLFVQAEPDVVVLQRHLCNSSYTYTLFDEGWRKVTTFKLNEYSTAASISHNPPSQHSFSNPTTKLKKTKRGLTAQSMWGGIEVEYVQTAPLPPMLEDDGYYDQSCFRNGNLTIEQLRQKPLFKMATTIKLVAFEAKHTRVPLDKNGQLIEGDCKQILALSQQQIDSLADVLYNYNYSDSLTVKRLTVGACYEPRHAILFYNNTGKLFAYLELCFECRGNDTNMRLQAFGDFCEGKYELLENFFRQSGITFFSKDDKTSGIQKTIEEPIISN